MRWDNLTITAEEQARLPGYREPAVVRHFDAPEALDTRFYEVRAKSALNQVPKQSRMPFRWTINPYRGCSHACVYCTHPDTPILMADGRTKPIAHLSVGDEIYGTQRRGTYRHYVRTEVLAHWSSVKRAYRITLEDGTELVASADHRFLTGRGWKHVTGADQGRARRPHLTIGCELMGTGRFASSPAISPDYRRGYLCGLIRGDGHLGTYSYERPGRSRDEHHRFRLALCDEQALSNTCSTRVSSLPRSSSRQPPPRDARLGPCVRRLAPVSNASRSSSAGRCRRATTGARASSRASSTPKGAGRALKPSGSRTPIPRSSTGQQPALGILVSTR